MQVKPAFDKTSAKVFTTATSSVLFIKFKSAQVPSVWQALICLTAGGQDSVIWN